MHLQKLLVSLCIFAGMSMAANFTSFDTTVQVKIWSTGLPDSTFIKLRNTGFTLAYALKKTNDCPTAVIGDFVIRPDAQWVFQSTQQNGDSASHFQSMVVYYCDYQVYSRRILVAGSKYQIHQWWKSDGTSDSIYTKVKTVVNDSTFVLTVSAQDFALTTALQSELGNLPKWTSKNGYTPNGRKINASSKIWIDSRGNKIINMNR